MKVLLIDNFDSFTYNLFHLIRIAGAHHIDVIQNDCLSDSAIHQADFIVISPGPGLPAEAGRLNDVLRTIYNKKKILGVCLGHQAIGELFGARLVPALRISHGESSEINILNPSLIFDQVPSLCLVGRYHSWVLSKEQFPDELEITAIDSFGQIMAIRHKNLDITGVQFHPESIMTPMGLMMIRNWLVYS